MFLPGSRVSRGEVGYLGGWVSGGVGYRGAGYPGLKVSREYVQHPTPPQTPPEGTWGQGPGRGLAPDRMTDTCENITFPQLRWWAVISYLKNLYELYYLHLLDSS